MAAGGVKIGVLFPGQGSQTVGMGVDVAEKSDVAKSLFESARRVLGYDLLAMQREGPEERLRETKYSQPAIFTTNVALCSAVGESLAPIVTAGHSFGEFCSLVVSRSLAFEDALRIVDERGRAMQDAADRAMGGMTAILGLPPNGVREVVDRVRAETGARVQLANFNSPTQIVVSGDLDAVTAAGEAAVAAGAKRAVPLNVSGAWHSELMEPAVARFAAAVESGNFAVPAFDVVSNVDAKVYRDVAVIKENLVRSIVQEVRWHDAAETVLSYGLDLVVEFGASGVLGPLVRRMSGAPQVMVVSDYAGVLKLRDAIATHTGDALESKA
jgi:[acyl-carrier-protein] S-malonyltransferase